MKDDNILKIAAASAVIVIVVIAGLLYFNQSRKGIEKDQASSNNMEVQSVLFSGLVKEVNLENKSIRLIDGSNQEMLFSISSTTKILDENGNSVKLDYFKKGFMATVLATKASGDKYEANNLEVSLAPNIIIDSPKDGETIGDIITVSGRARVFENQLSYRIKADNKIIEEGLITANGEMGQYGEINLAIYLDKRVMISDKIILELFSYSPKDGGVENLTSLSLNYKTDNSLAELLNNDFKVSLLYPANWKTPSENKQLGFFGVDGWFYIEGLGVNKDGLNGVVNSLTDQKNKYFGSEPLVSDLKIDGLSAKLIMPSKDQALEMKNRATIILSFPATVTIKKQKYDYLILNADKGHIDVIGQKIILTDKNPLTIKAFFNNNMMDTEATCNKVFSVERVVPYTQAVARAALEELLKGPSKADKEGNYSTSLNTGIKIKSLEITNGIAKVDFSKEISKNLGGSCRVASIYAQITETLKQFPTIKSVLISVEGETEGILQP